MDIVIVFGFIVAQRQVQGKYIRLKSLKNVRSAKTQDIVLDFVKELPSTNHLIIADSYYGDLPLAIKLDKEGYKFILCCKKDRPSKNFNDLN